YYHRPDYVFSSGMKRWRNTKQNQHNTQDAIELELNINANHQMQVAPVPHLVLSGQQPTNQGEISIGTLLARQPTDQDEASIEHFPDTQLSQNVVRGSLPRAQSSED